MTAAQRLRRWLTVGVTSAWALAGVACGEVEPKQAADGPVASSPGAPAVQAPPTGDGTAWFGVEGIGLVAWQDGAFRVLHPAKAFAGGIETIIAIDERAWVGTPIKLFDASPAELTSLTRPGVWYAIADDGDQGLWRFDKTGLSRLSATGEATHRIAVTRGALTMFGRDQVALDERGVPWVLTHTGEVVQCEGCDGDHPSAVPVAFPEPGPSALAFSDVGTGFAVVGAKLHRWEVGDGSWTPIAELPPRGLAMAGFAVSADGAVFYAARHGDVHVYEADGTPRARHTREDPGATPDLLARHGAFALDEQGRAWLATEDGLEIWDESSGSVQRIPQGTVPELAGRITAIALQGTVSVPPRGERSASVVSGQILKVDPADSEHTTPFVGLRVTLCGRTWNQWPIRSEGRPCEGAGWRRAGVTDEAGKFSIEDVPAGPIAAQVEDVEGGTWHQASTTSRLSETGRVPYGEGEVSLPIWTCGGPIYRGSRKCEPASRAAGPSAAAPDAERTRRLRRLKESRSSVAP